MQVRVCRAARCSVFCAVCRGVGSGGLGVCGCKRLWIELLLDVVSTVLSLFLSRSLSRSLPPSLSLSLPTLLRPCLGTRLYRASLADAPHLRLSEYTHELVICIFSPARGHY